MRALFSWSVVVLGSIGLGCSSPDSTTPDPLIFHDQYASNVSTVYGPVSGQRANDADPLAPNFFWKDPSGRLDSLSGHRGKIVVLNFWATWCPPCNAESPEIQALSQEGGDVLVLTVAEDATGDAFSVVRNRMTDNHFTFEAVVDSMFRIYNQYFEHFSIPRTLIIDPQGSIRYSFTGEGTKPEFDSLISTVR